ncbi:MAG: hypothetical protein UT87_C0005G0032 [Candidatus Levybacteria bacterium GW2011_GWC1_40_19]|nr:MAG: hypothetical protein UT44_C0003G0009 [Candidatus Levybacteria bacterium GW2011_GWA1_39_32]KKR51496.1 MAG: hypothetical protein UT87_C0005G0032 [Candidatus Levybacteria bacterium GW2011_GWC1_40_19]KKR95439.1 MAG: hypothetical protein UU45_C0001G0034 [Candidatus Levybacteria bacterium GW2011_GWA2_41_15]KKS01924.1 MAG: hypothetical protein UU52_C0005G0033 [Candidatus Levybacteria bacterium GW2011_GWB1_41_21]
MEKADSKQKLKNFLEQMYGKKLSDEEVREYKDRFVKFMGLLVEIDQRTKKRK